MFRCKKCEEKQEEVNTLQSEITRLKRELERYEKANLDKFLERQSSDTKIKKIDESRIRILKRFDYSNRRIAKELGVSEYTIRQRLKKLKDKL